MTSQLPLNSTWSLGMTAATTSGMPLGRITISPSRNTRQPASMWVVWSEPDPKRYEPETT